MTTIALFHSNLCLYHGSSKIAEPRDVGQGTENGFAIRTRTFPVRLTEKHGGISHLNQKLLIIALNCPQIRTLWTGKAWVNLNFRGQPYSPPSHNTNLVSLTAAFLRKSGLTQALLYPGHKMQIDALTFRLPCAIWKSLSSPYCTAAFPRELGLRKLCQIRVHKTRMDARTFHLSCAICKSLSSHPNCFSTRLENRSPDRSTNANIKNTCHSIVQLKVQFAFHFTSWNSLSAPAPKSNFRSAFCSNCGKLSLSLSRFFLGLSLLLTSSDPSPVSSLQTNGQAASSRPC